jgi:hypothetical protein
MNAYELADKLDKSKAWLDSLNTQYKNGFGKYCLLPNEVALMLRQQADRIAELEEELYFKNYYEELPDTPVGIIGKIGDSPIHDLVHRTTPQIKELSDEEIETMFFEILGIEPAPSSVFDFARAILKKASE